MSIKLKIDGYEHEGAGISHYNGKVIFVPNTIKDEECLVDIIKDNKNYAVGKVQQITKKSNLRVEPVCPYYEKCGGCSYLHVSLAEERKIKKDNVKNILKKYANIDINPRYINSKNEYNYRNKISLKIENYEFGYYNANSHEFCKINECKLAKVSINKIINSKYIKVKNGSMVIRSNYNDEVIIKIDTKEEYYIDIDKLISENKIVGIIVNDKLLYGDNFYYERVGGFLFKVNINSFFQVNLDILEKVFAILKKYKFKNVVDLYSGVGTLGIALNKDKLFGIEIIPDAVIDANKNSKLNKQNNFYMLGDSSKISEIKDEIDTIIVDPPRSGLNKNTIDNIININANNIIYMSCNPITLARDLNILKEKYNLLDFYILEMFPRTKHVECICILECKIF